MLKAFLSESKSGVKPHTWWDHKFAGHNKEATLELKAIFDGDAPFDTPKPVKLVRRLIELVARPGDIVLDFFAGSGPLGHAAFQYAVESNNTIRFLLVQIPEATGRIDFNTIAEITKERLRRAAKKVKEEHPDYAGDLGFRVYKLDESNLRTWEAQPDNLDGTLYDHIEHIKPDRTEQDVLYEVLLKLGLDLCVPIETRQMAGKTVYSVGAGVLFVSLPESLSRDEAETVATGIGSWREELGTEGDTTVVIRDSAFADDVAKANLAAILEQHGIKTVRSL